MLPRDLYVPCKLLERRPLLLRRLLMMLLLPSSKCVEYTHS
jgi:hypothetical protein